MSVKRRAVATAIAVSVVLTIVKAIVGFLTMSMSVLASALDSFMDACSMVVTMFAVATAEKPADEDHPFGHGKAEAMGGLVQAVLIAISAGFLIFQAFHRIIDGYRLEDEGLGIGVIAISMIVSIMLAAKLRRIGRETESTAIMAGALNFGADILSYAGALVALALEKWLFATNADPIISILISLNIIASAVRVGRDAAAQLMDKTLPEETLNAINRTIHAHEPTVRGYHKLRTRRVGAEKYIDFHVEIDRAASFETAHELTEDIIRDLQTAIPGAHVIVHSDPV